MEWHQGGFANPERKQSQQQAKSDGGDLFVRDGFRQDSSEREFQGAGQRISPSNRKHEKSDRGGQQNPEVNPSAVASFFIAMVRDQWIGRDRHDLVGNKQREQVLCIRCSDGRENGEGKAAKESCLIVFVVTPHVADRVDRRQDPKPRGNEREKHPQRFDFECDLESGQPLTPHPFRTLAGEHAAGHSACQQKENGCDGERAAFANVRRFAG